MDSESDFEEFTPKPHKREYQIREVEKHFRTNMTWLDVNVDEVVNILAYNTNKMKSWENPLKEKYDKMPKNVYEKIQSGMKVIEKSLGLKNSNPSLELIEILNTGKVDLKVDRIKIAEKHRLNSYIVEKRSGPTYLNLSYNSINAVINPFWSKIMLKILHIKMEPSEKLFMLFTIFCIGFDGFRSDKNLYTKDRREKFNYKSNDEFAIFKLAMPQMSFFHKTHYKMVLGIFLQQFGHLEDDKPRCHKVQNNNLAAYLICCMIQNALSGGILFRMLSFDKLELNSDGQIFSYPKPCELERHFIQYNGLYDVKIEYLLNALNYKQNHMKSWNDPFTKTYADVSMIPRSTCEQIQSGVKILSEIINSKKSNLYEKLIENANEGLKQTIGLREQKIETQPLHTILHSNKFEVNTGFSFMYIFMYKEWMALLCGILSIPMTPVAKLGLLIVVLCLGIFYVGISTCPPRRIIRHLDDNVVLQGFPADFEFGVIIFGIPQLTLCQVQVLEQILIKFLRPFGKLKNGEGRFSFENNAIAIYTLCTFLLHGLADGSFFNTISLKMFRQDNDTNSSDE